MNNKKIGIIGFFAFTASSLMSMVLMPTFASSGFNLIFFMILASFLWFIPTAIAAAEMASILKWKNGGIFEWTKITMGERWGFAAVFYQWFQTTVVYTIFFSFLASGIDYLLGTNLLDNNLYQFLIIILAFVVITLINSFGIKITLFITKLSLPIGVIIPTIIMIVLSFSFVFGHKNGVLPPQLDVNVLPTSGIFELVIFSSYVLSMTAIEVSANSINVLKNSKKNYPIVIALVVSAIMTLNTLAGISIAIVLPLADINFSNAIFLVFDTIIVQWFGNQYLWISKIITVLIIFGIVGQVSSIIVEPSIGLANSLTSINAPKWITKENKWGAKYNILWIQGLLMIMWLAIILFSSSNKNISMLICISITSGTYLFTYLLLLTAHIIAAIKFKHLERNFGFKNKYLKICLSIIGLLTTIATLIFIFFMPYPKMNTNLYLMYLLIVLFSLVVILIIPFVFYQINKKRKNYPIDNQEVTKLT